MRGERQKRSGCGATAELSVHFGQNHLDSRRTCSGSRTCNRLTGQTTFSNNGAWFGGAIYNRKDAPSYFDDEEIEDYETPVITFPDDTVFIDNTATVRAMK